MHWSSGLFLLCFAVLLLPLQLRFEAEHTTSWRGAITMTCLWISRQIQLPKTAAEKPTQQHHNMFFTNSWKQRFQNRWQRTSVQIIWSDAIAFLRQTIQIVSRHIKVTQLSLRYHVGFQRPDWTAYSYGLFWTILSFFPINWIEQGDFFCQPDFQRPRQDFQLYEIIRCSVGQVILIAWMLFWLTVKTMLEQNRKEQILYES